MSNSSKSSRPFRSIPPKQGLYNPAFEHDSCGVGFVAHIKGKRSHQILIDAEEVLRNMDHRGACGCEPNTGDGAGILTALPHEFLKRVVRKELGADLPPAGQFAAGIVFLPQDAGEREKCMSVVEELIRQQGQRLVGWRKVPTETVKADIGPSARAGEPYIEQLVIAAGSSSDSFI
jgi:glutamate synthase (NADPH) large chain